MVVEVRWRKGKKRPNKVMKSKRNGRGKKYQKKERGSDKELEYYPPKEKAGASRFRAHPTRGEPGGPKKDNKLKVMVGRGPQNHGQQGWVRRTEKRPKQNTSKPGNLGGGAKKKTHRKNSRVKKQWG